jgi:diguanylate cyclase (GGDEF)-like protein
MGEEELRGAGYRISTEILEGLELFRGEGQELLDWVLHSCAVRSLLPGAVLLAPGSHNDALYIILAGRAQVKFTLDEPHSNIYLEAGECAGEMSIIEGAQPSAMVVAHSPCQVLVLDAEVIWTLIDRSPVVARNLLYILSTRVRRNNVALVQSRQQQRIHERDALNDALTGLHNRRWMERTLCRIVQRCARGREPLALLMIDTDHFKRYNDEHGHLAGDQLLTVIGRLISENVRPTDHACRYGGDEFLVVLPQAGPAEAMQIAERVCRSIRDQASAGAGALKVAASVSVGVASLEAGMNLRQLLASADAALYRAKAAGRGRVSR